MNGSVLTVKNIDIDFHLPLSHSQRSYQLIELSNGLRTLVINDKSSELFSAAMVVGSGSANDPNDALGLAHLCEHMLFLGTKTSPVPNQLDSIVSSAGGFTNAYTTMQQTCYHLELSSFAKVRDERAFIIDSVLEIFASLFKCPLFKEKYIKGEIKAVDEEHRGNTNDIDKILFHALRSLASPNHVFRRFGTGNKETLSRLSTKKLQRYLRAYFQRFYIARKMVLVIKGPQSVNHLKKLAMTYFSDIPKTSLEHTRLSGSSVSDHDIYFSPQLYGYLDTPLFQQEYNAVLLKVPNNSRVRLCYPLKEITGLQSYHRIKNLVCNLLGDESPKSFCEYLKRKRQWATMIMVFVQNTIFSDDILVVDISLTPSGLKNLPQLVDTLHYYINYTIIRGAYQDLEKIIRDLTILEDSLFRNRETEGSFVDEICGYAETLEKGGFDLRDLVRGYGDWDPGKSSIMIVQELQKAANQCFTEENLKIVISSEDLWPVNLFTTEKGAYQPMVDHYFQYEFISVLNNDQMTFFNPDLSLNFELPNIPTPLKESMNGKRTSKQSSVGFVRGVETAAEHPQLKFFNSCLEVWTTNNAICGAVSTHITFNIQFRDIESTPENLVGIELLAELMGEELKYELYHYELVGTFWGVFANTNGLPSILVSVSGMKDEVVTVFKTIMNCFRSLRTAEDEVPYQKFKKARVNTRKRTEEILNSSGTRKVFSAAYLVLEEGLIPPEDKIDALEIIDTKFIKEMSKDVLCTGPYGQLLMDGDFTDHESFILTEEAKLDNGGAESYDFLAKKSSKTSHILPEGRNFLFPMHGAEDDTANTLLYYIQLGDRSDTELYTWGKLFEHLLSYTALDELRTRRRLAYLVFTGMKFFRNSFGIHITIPSGEHECDTLSGEVERYLGILQKNLQKLTEKEFQEDIVEPFTQTISQTPTQVKTPSGLFISLQPLQGSGDKPDSGEFMSHWSHMDQIINGTYRFGGTECEEPIDKTFLETLTLKEFLRYFQTYISVDSAQRSSLIIANAAGTQSYEAKKSQFAAIIFSQLQDQGMNITQVQVSNLLEKCKDQEDFTDISMQLKKYFKETKQGTKLMRLAFKNFAGSMLRSAASTFSVRPQLPNSEKYIVSKKTEINNYKAIQGLCYVGSRISWYEKLQTLEQLAHSGEGTAQFI
ncbi:hypothetical protein FT663_00812 [Candidozyma haemuli var. vulneris]|uniref:Peptidase M16 N-terminal domain-containing protein n=1 Tax=Candidozyma haemuli TaxID=45357 RepID=A0A2V1APS8_9ASCO|nr:hypothetical protein CXQ85_001664 [[Candida] haemuloni]KAF3992902.1 hypothetical protein FT662_00904 [[Candida] haemuloni var. vulneris]KAF3995113.1 hypothetical protein FT663_00812 [[Candida] haemuloni var. vulneris]PVH19889.1 hypothetical protein CXQ85_001664 [[Candida] haemuloni]